ncbi:MAG: penicillin-binding protein 2 [Verrucomicrobiota bacterium]
MLIFDQLKKSDRKLRLVAIAILTGLTTLLVGLYFVQVISSKRYVKDLNNQSFRTVRVPSIRGQILDRNRLPLAGNRALFNINLYLEELREAFKEEYKLRKASRKLDRSEMTELGLTTRFNVISNLVQKLSLVMQQPIAFSENQFRKHYEHWTYAPLPLLTNLAPEQVARFQENSSKTPALNLEIQPVRYYPYKTTAAHVLGYLQRSEGADDDEETVLFNYRLPDYEGKVGIEAAFDKELRGSAGVKSVLVNSLGYRQSETVITPPEPGKNVILTLDLPIQQATERALRSRNPNERGAAIVMDARNGDVLALVSSPAPDPNQFTPRISPEYWQELTDPRQLPLINRATGAAFAPGSIFKIVVALAGLEAGTINPSFTMTNPGFIRVGNRTIHDTAPPGEYNFQRAFIKSSNAYFIRHGLDTGVEKILSMGRRFHLGEAVDLPTLQNVRGFFPTREWIQRQRGRGDPWTDGDTANLSIGQGAIAVTPMQMAVMTAAVANGGKVVWPRIVQRIEPQEPAGDEDTALVFPNRVRSELGVNPTHLALIREAMRGDVEDEGSGWRAAVPGMQVCGKTGTAEVKQGGKLVDKITWFVSFAPYESARYVVVVMVQSGASGGGTCAPIAQQIYRAIKEREAQRNNTKPDRLASAN